MNPKGVLCLASLKVYLNRLNIGCNSHFLLFIFSTDRTFLAAVAKKIFIQLSPKTGSHDAVQKTRKFHRRSNAVFMRWLRSNAKSFRVGCLVVCFAVRCPSPAMRIPCWLGAWREFESRSGPLERADAFEDQSGCNRSVEHPRINAATSLIMALRNALRL